MTSARSRFAFFKFTPPDPSDPLVAAALELLDSGQPRDQVISGLIANGELRTAEAEAAVDQALAYKRSVKKSQGQRAYTKGIAFALVGVGALLVMWFIGAYGGRLLLGSLAMMAVGAGYAVYGLCRALVNAETGGERRKLGWGLSAGLAFTVALGAAGAFTLFVQPPSPLVVDPPDESYIVMALEGSDEGLGEDTTFQGSLTNTHYEMAIKDVWVRVNVYSGVSRYAYRTYTPESIPSRIGPGETWDFTVVDNLRLRSIRYDMDAQWEWTNP